MRERHAERRWATSLWLAHSHARRGVRRAAPGLLDFVLVEAETAPEGASALHAALELRRSLHAMAR